MIRRGVTLMLVALIMAPGVSRARRADDGEAPPVDTVSVDAVEAPPADSASVDTASVASPRSLLFLPDRFYRTGTTLTFSMHSPMSTDRLYGFERYRASPLECAYRGAGAGMTLGMATGAFGMMAGAWGER